MSLLLVSGACCLPVLAAAGPVSSSGPVGEVRVLPCGGAAAGGLGVRSWCGRGARIGDRELVGSAARAWRAAPVVRPPEQAPISAFYAETGPPGQVWMTVVGLAAPAPEGGELVAFVTSDVVDIAGGAGGPDDARLRVRAVTRLVDGSPAAVGFVDHTPDPGDAVAVEPAVAAFAVAAPGTGVRLWCALTAGPEDHAGGVDPVTWVPQVPGASAANTVAVGSGGATVALAPGVDDPAVRPVLPDPVTGRVGSGRPGDVLAERGRWRGTLDAGSVPARALPQGWRAVTAVTDHPLALDPAPAGEGFAVTSPVPDGVEPGTRVDLVSPAGERLVLGLLAAEFRVSSAGPGTAARGRWRVQPTEPPDLGARWPVLVIPAA
ncbi:hypothetical protein V5P93_003926 [Actinokineospora auranticolor]|uniref:hypothetical protein n=1 Tax=Actinokineospora auranticolor TaxID=155976 RepID=UPI000CEBB047|nr:hypothetical protein [Actinokineospora auranticolor]